MRKEPSKKAISKPLTDSEGSWSLRERIPNDAELGRKILDTVLQQLEHHAWSSEDIFSVHLAMDEALVNAMKHGNRFDPDKNVHIECHVSKDRVRIEIADEGPGFNPEAVPDCRCEERLEVPSGRGLFLMRSFMCRVEYLERGNRVLLEKNRVRAPSQPAER